MRKKELKIISLIIMFFITGFLSYTAFLISANISMKHTKIDSNKSFKEFQQIPSSSLWIYNGNPICEAINNQLEPDICSDESGGAIIVWEDGRAGTSNKNIYAQRVDVNGTFPWIYSETAICTFANNQESPEICSDKSGGAIIVWEDERAGTGNINIYAQRVDATGACLWNDNGIVICSIANNQEEPEVCSDELGGAIIIWEDERAGTGNTNIYAQRVDTTGTCLWNDNGTAICTIANNQEELEICCDESGGAIIVWDDERAGASNINIYAQKIDATGTCLWNDNGTAICTFNNNQQEQMVINDGTGGVIIVWEDERAGSENINIYAQRVDASGTAQWTTNGIAICSYLNNQEDPDICSDKAGGAIIVWKDERVASSNDNIYAQRINPSGIIQWNNNGTAICTINNEQKKSIVCNDESGGAIILWQDERDGVDYINVYAQRINASGTCLWNNNGNVMCNAKNDQKDIQICSNGSGGVIIAWVDYRAGIDNSDIYAQKINSDGSIDFPTIEEIIEDILEDLLGDDNDEEGVLKEALESIPGYDLYYILAFICISVILLVYRNLKKSLKCIKRIKI